MKVEEAAIEALRRIQKDEAHKITGFASIAHGDYDAEVNNCNMIDVAIQALEEVEQYRALGTVEDIIKYRENLEQENHEYSCIGTVEELKEAREKQIPKKPIYKEMPYSEEVGFNNEWHCPNCNSYVGYFSEGMSKPEQMKYCNECGQHIARDWEEGGTSD